MAIYPGMYQPGLRVMADTGVGTAEWLRHLGSPNPIPFIQPAVAPGGDGGDGGDGGAGKKQDGGEGKNDMMMMILQGGGRKKRKEKTMKRRKVEKIKLIRKRENVKKRKRKN